MADAGRREGSERSWYAESAAPAPPLAHLEGDIACDVLVVGAGYTGLSTALELAERGYDVVVLEAEQVGWGASGRNGGHIASAFNKSMGQIEAWVGRDDARRLWELDREARDLIGDRVRRYRIDCDLRWGYVVAAIKKRHLRDLAEALEEWRDYGDGESRLLDREGIRAVVDGPRYVGGLYDPHSGAFHPLDYARGLARAATEAGARIFEQSRVTRLHEGDPAVAETARGRVTARFVALAGNAYLTDLSPGVARLVRPRIMPVGAYMIATEPFDPAFVRQILPGGEAVADAKFVLNYFRFSSDNRLLFGGGVSYSTFAGPNLEGRLKAKLAHYLPRLAGARVRYRWGGLVGISLKRLPHLGRIAPNILFAQGFSGHGCAHTGIAGRVMAEAIAGTAERFDVFARIPHRAFPGGRLMRMPALVLAMLWYRLRDAL